MVAHLSACRYLFKGHALHLERERIRSSMGALRVFGECWPLGKRTYREMGIIAREILGLADTDIPHVVPPVQRSTPLMPSPPLPQTQPESMSDIPLDFDWNNFDFHDLTEDLPEALQSHI